MAYESLLVCKKCHSNLVIPKRIVVEKLTVFVWAKCSHCNKEVKFTLPLPQVHEWVDLLAESFFRCPKCAVSGVVTRTITSGDFTKLKLYCPSCQKAFTKVVNVSVFNYLMASNYNQRKPKAEQPAVPAYYVPMPPGMPPAPPAPAPPVAPVKPAPPVAPSQKKCTNCNAPLTPDASFCRACGVPVESGTEKGPRCPFCGASISEKANKCPKCSSEVKCKKCGSLLFSNAKFCVKCGQVLKGEVEEIKTKPILTCHFCGAAIELEDKVCPECGKPTVCPNCGNHLKSGVRYCNKCGNNVSEITMETPAPQEEGLEEDEEAEEEPKGAPAKTVSCPNCGMAMSEIYTFCTNCGSHLEK
ncbi:MAG TPA: zinc ribbon domain-containing protein [Candidatus Deferrimicrobium sp.]|nr:zinc ribbon domain-containing protein [Candidatus Deferrimicrobium sp.]